MFTICTYPLAIIYLHMFVTSVANRLGDLKLQYWTPCTSPTNTFTEPSSDIINRLDNSEGIYHIWKNLYRILVQIWSLCLKGNAVEGQSSKTDQELDESPRPEIMTFRTLHFHERLGVMARGLGSAMFPIVLVLFFVVLLRMVEVNKMTRFVK